MLAAPATASSPGGLCAHRLSGPWIAHRTGIARATAGHVYKAINFQQKSDLFGERTAANDVRI